VLGVFFEKALFAFERQYFFGIAKLYKADFFGDADLKKAPAVGALIS
jgi:hypothetical protein